MEIAQKLVKMGIFAWKKLIFDQNKKDNEVWVK